jgi:hypothetical protein
MGSNNANRRGPLHGRIQIRKFLASWAAPFLLLLASAASASATTFTLTYNDLNDTPNLTLNGVPVPCTTQVGEQCVIQIPTTAAAHVTATTLQNFTHWAEPGTGGLLCADGNLGPCISDALNSNAKAVLAAAQLAVPLYLPLQFVFMSDPPGATEPVGLPACSITPDKCLLANGSLRLENGAPEGAGTITFSDGDILNVKVASDVSDVPEPSSLILFGSGLVIAGGFLRRRRRLLNPLV